MQKKNSTRCKKKILNPNKFIGYKYLTRLKIQSVLIYVNTKSVSDHNKILKNSHDLSPV